jgi:DNA repair exonuclease SbcCD nuclease subunit
MWSERRNDVGEYELDDSFLRKNFDYIALGHSHGRSEVNDNTCYSGSVECFSFDEVGQKKGILLVDLSTGIIEPHEIYDSKYRIDYPPIDCLGLTSGDIISEILEQCKLDEINNKIIRCNLKNVDRNQYKKISPSMLSELRNLCIDLKITYEFKKEKMIDIQINDKNLSDEFSRYIGEELSKMSYNPEIKDKILKYGSNLMNEVEKARNTEVLNR